LDGGKTLAHLLKNLPHRQIVTKSRTEGFRHAKVLNVRTPRADFSGLYQRVRNRWARPRRQVEAEITARVIRSSQPKGNFNDWD